MSGQESQGSHLLDLALESVRYRSGHTPPPPPQPPADFSPGQRRAGATESTGPALWILLLGSKGLTSGLLLDSFGIIGVNVSLM